MNVSPKNKAHAVWLLCRILFAPLHRCFPAQLWVELYPMEVILYGLLETVSKQRRAQDMRDFELVQFAAHVMESRHKQVKEMLKAA